jgi:phage-related protein
MGMERHSESNEPILRVVFYRTGTGHEPVREWLKGLLREDCRKIGEDVKTAQFGWPLGMPLIKKLGAGLWEVRSRISQGISRVLFSVEGDTMILLHGFVKKSQKTPLHDLNVALGRLRDLHEE